MAGAPVRQGINIFPYTCLIAAQFLWEKVVLGSVLCCGVLPLADVGGTCLLMKVDSHGFLFPGATEDESMRNFKKYMYDELCMTSPEKQQRARALEDDYTEGEFYLVVSQLLKCF